MYWQQLQNSRKYYKSVNKRTIKLTKFLSRTTTSNLNARQRETKQSSDGIGIAVVFGTTLENFINNTVE